MRRRTKPRVVWLPNDPLNSVGTSATTQTFVVDVVGPIGAISAAEIPLVIDETQDPLDVGVSLSDIYNSGYRLRRIVGKIFVACQQIAEDTPKLILVSAGIIVRRVDALAQSLSIAAQSTAAPGIIHPGEIENASDPWIWKRSWLLANNSATNPGGALGLTTFPECNVEYGSVADGPHVDQKTARIIGPEERLFLDVGTQILVAGDPLLITSVQVFADLRMLGSLRTTVGNRRNATR